MDLKRTTVFILLLIVAIGCSSGSEHSEEAERILQDVAESYKKLESFELEGVMATNVITGDPSQNMELPVYFAREQPGSMRIEVSGKNFSMVLVSDGSTTWTYLPSIGEYTQRESAVIQSAGGRQNVNISSSADFKGIGEQFTKSYEAITNNLKKARILGEETVTLEDGSTYEAYKIEAEYERNPDLTNSRVSPTTYLIDKESKIVLRQNVQVSTSATSPNGRSTMLQSIRLRRIDLSPEFEDSVFAYTPPQDAEKVEEFSMSGLELQKSELVGQQAPNFELTSFEGETISLNSLRGNVVILDFWATWCGPCREAHPHIQKLHEDLQDQGLVVLGINSEEEKTVRRYMDDNNYTFTNLNDLDESVSGRYNVSSIPSVYIIDREGNVSSHLLGYQPEERLRKAIKNAGL